ncbi:hypothetical protein AWB81_04212 [Caballeronia arationis]|uniref:hypothetical protein n=1 Tax=Caballeronia arationis TaxID=1777142 RepID=UPI00074BECBA|nr:hypothetical protein [Caballeronia arationis]SAK83479.1 hypothetical protein AWB81_04212 [Caballeronia arationis]
MSKSKGNTPNVELRRRNNKSQAFAPADELKEVLSGEPKPMEQAAGDGAQRRPLLDMGDGTYMSDAGTLAEVQEQYRDGDVVKAAEPGERVGSEAAERECVLNEGYRAKNLILIVTRLAGSLSSELNESIKSTLELFPHVIEGAARGFTINLDSKAVYEPIASSLRMTFDERAGRAIGKLFETWGREIGRVGVGAHTTVDFMLVEPDATGRLVLDAWNCRSMFPEGMTTCHGGRYLHGTRDYADAFEDGCEGATAGR